MSRWIVPARWRGGQRLGNLAARLAGFRDRQRSAVVHDAHVDAVDQFHDEVSRPVDAVGVGGHHDARMMQPAKHADLPVKRRRGLAVAISRGLSTLRATKRSNCR